MLPFYDFLAALHRSASRRTPHYAGLHAHSRKDRRAGPVTGLDYTRKNFYQATVTRFRPFCLLLYINSSVLWMILSTVSSGWLTLAPMEIVTLSFVLPSWTLACSTSLLIFSATILIPPSRCQGSVPEILRRPSGRMNLWRADCASLCWQ